MFHSINNLKGEWVQSINGDFGHIKEFLFDDERWSIKYLVVDTGHLLPGKKVLISPEAFDVQDWKLGKFSVKLSKEQILQCPDIDEHPPVKRSMEKEFNEYYGNKIYWADGSVVLKAFEVEPKPIDYHCEDHLRSTNEVSGYKVHAEDGDIGHVEDFILDDSAWNVRYVLIHTGHLFTNKKVLFSPTWISRFSCHERKIDMSLLRNDIMHSPAFSGVDKVEPEYEKNLYDHYRKMI